MKLFALFLIVAAGASAHVISMSNGFATVTGNRIEYVLRMPTYEVPSGADLVKTLFGAIRFTSGFETARRLDGECHTDSGTYLCAANYLFSAPVEKLGIDCRFYEVTVPNHIHMLHAENNGKFDQAILDSAFPSASLAFRAPTSIELAVDQSASGAMRVWTNAAQMLLLLALVLAARGWREFLLLIATFLLGECAGTLGLLKAGWQPSLRFAEAAAALALAYLALEILAFPKSGGRWLLGLLFGAFQGMFFSLFLGESGYLVGWVLLGAAFAAATASLLFGAVWRWLARTSWQTGIRVAASTALAATGGVWFVLRLRS